MHKFAEMIVRALEKRTIIPAADHDVYVYGFDAAPVSYTHLTLPTILRV